MSIIRSGEFYTIDDTKARLRAEGRTDLDLQSVIEEAGISGRRWISLRRWEEKEYGRPRTTDLTRP